VSVEDETRDLKVGDIVHIPPDVEHGFEGTPGGENLVLFVVAIPVEP
jgi:quercetin dioxygenase-like cupin family protein